MFQSTKFTPMMTVRVPERRAHSHSPDLPTLPACWLNDPWGPITATHRGQLMRQTSRRSNRGCRAASVTPVPTRRRERTISPHRDEAHWLYFHHVKYFFLLWCVFFGGGTKSYKMTLIFINTLKHKQGIPPSASFLCENSLMLSCHWGCKKNTFFFLNLTKLEAPDEQSSCLKSKLHVCHAEHTFFFGYSKIFAQYCQYLAFGISTRDKWPYIRTKDISRRR